MVSTSYIVRMSMTAMQMNVNDKNAKLASFGLKPFSVLVGLPFVFSISFILFYDFILAEGRVSINLGLGGYFG